MVVRLFLLFLIVPVVEIYLLLKAGSIIGAIPTVSILIVVSLVGAWLVRHQGVLVISRIQDELALGRLPAAELLDGALIFMGGLLLITPGFFTDFLSIFLLIPATRSLIKQLLGYWLKKRLSGGTTISRRF